jgi:hypothetical protein
MVLEEFLDFWNLYNRGEQNLVIRQGKLFHPAYVLVFDWTIDTIHKTYDQEKLKF